MEARKIIITGGATRIGAAIARKLSGYLIDKEDVRQLSLMNQRLGLFSLT